MRLLLVAAFAALLCGHAVAQTDQPLARFGSFFVDPDLPEVIALTGEIGPSAPLDFRRALKAHPEVTTLALSSPGGDVTGALLVAQEVAFLGFETYIPAGFGCYSACAFIFFAGETRMVEGELGVHQVSGTQDNDYSTQLAVADIIDGMAEFGVPPSVIGDMLRTPPSSMKVYSALDAERIGINRNIAELTQSIPEAVATPSPPPAKTSALPPAPSFATIQTATTKASDTEWTEVLYQIRETGSIEATLLAFGLPPDNVQDFIGLLTAKVGSGNAPAWSQFLVLTWPYNDQKIAARVSLYTPEPPDGRLTHRITALMDPNGLFHEANEPK